LCAVALGVLLVVGVDAGLLHFLAFAGSVLTDFSIAFSHCAWRHVISLSNSDKETKQRKRLATAYS
jgi:hypothetical protein